MHSAPAEPLRQREFWGMADIDTHYYIEWGCGRVAMRAVGGWAPSAKTHIHAGTLMNCP